VGASNVDTADPTEPSATDPSADPRPPVALADADNGYHRFMPVELPRTVPVVMESDTQHTFPGAKERVVSCHDTTNDAQVAAERAVAEHGEGPPFFYAASITKHHLDALQSFPPRP
jgi:hypothetical protein